MNQKIKITIILFLSFFSVVLMQAQESIPATGGVVSGSGGSVSFTIGQNTYRPISGTNGTVIQGIQQPYEISTVTAIEDTDGISLEYLVYPNPTGGLVKLVIEPFDHKNFRFQLHSTNGTLLQDEKVENRETEISMDNLSPSIYFLRILKDNINMKVFKIVKK